MWTKPFLFGGVVGGTNTGTDGMTYYSGLSYEAQYTNAIIINGRLYYTLPLSDANGGGGIGTAADGGFVSVDLRTGKQYWYQDYALNPSFGLILDIESPNQHGVIPNGYLVATTSAPSFFGPAGPATWIFYDPLSGNWLFNITQVPSGTQVTGPNGEKLIYQLNAVAGWLAMWNSTQALLNGAVGSMLGNETYRPVAQIIDANFGWQWNVTVPTSINIPGSTIQDAYYD